jgi:anti-anti-sigma factor
MALAELSPETVSHRDLMASPNCDADGSVVRLRGEHDFYTAPELWEAMAKAIAFDDGDVVVDLSAVEFMGASTVGVLIRARAFLQKGSRSLTLRSPSTRALRVLGLCGVANTA